MKTHKTKSGIIEQSRPWFLLIPKIWKFYHLLSNLCLCFSKSYISRLLLAQFIRSFEPIILFPNFRFGLCHSMDSKNCVEGYINCICGDYHTAGKLGGLAVYIITAKLKFAKISYLHIYIWRSSTEMPNLNLDLLIFLQ